MSCATGDLAFVVSGWRCAATAYDAPGPRVVVAAVAVAVAVPASGMHTVTSIATPKADAIARP